MKYFADPQILRNENDAELAWAAIAPCWDDLPLGKPNELNKFMDDLTEGQRGLLALDWCQEEIRNGGFEQLFRNPTGDLLPWVIEGFRLVGAEEYARILAEAASALGPDYPQSPSERVRVYLALAAPEKECIDDLEGEFFDLIGSQEHDLERYRGEFVRHNPGEFIRDKK